MPGEGIRHLILLGHQTSSSVTAVAFS